MRSEEVANEALAAAAPRIGAHFHAPAPRRAAAAGAARPGLLARALGALAGALKLGA
jgi:transposase